MRNIRLRCSHFVGLPLLLISCLTVSTAGAQLWKQFVPTTRGAANDPGDYALTQEKGPWLIVAASFSGEGAERQAGDLAHELRERFHMRAYVHEQSFDFSDDSKGRGLDEYGGPIRRRYQRGDHVQEFAVLVGDFQTIDDPDAQKTLDSIKTLQPDALNVDTGKTAQSMAQVRQFEDAVMEKLGKQRKRGPMAKAFLSRNPLLPQEYFVPKGVDDFVAKMNQGVEHSLLDCPGKYTVQVAAFRGRTMLQANAKDDPDSSAFWKRKKKEDRNPLVDAAENAHLLTAELRARGFEAYEFHDRDESIVTVGSFPQVAQKLSDGRTVPIPGVQKIIETFGAAYDTPSEPLAGSRDDPRAQQKVEELKHQVSQMMTDQNGQFAQGMNPKHAKIYKGRKFDRVIPFDVYPQAIDVPKRSVSSAYAGK